MGYIVCGPHRSGLITLKNCNEVLSVAILQKWINNLIAMQEIHSSNKGTTVTAPKLIEGLCDTTKLEVDYVHGIEIVNEKCSLSSSGNGNGSTDTTACNSHDEGDVDSDNTNKPV